MPTALQNIERAKGAAEERRWLAAEVRELIKLYKGDLVLQVLLDKIRERNKSERENLS